MNIWFGRRLRKLAWWLYRDSRRAARHGRTQQKQRQQKARAQQGGIPSFTPKFPAKPQRQHGGQQRQQFMQQQAQDLQREEEIQRIYSSARFEAYKRGKAFPPIEEETPPPIQESPKPKLVPYAPLNYPQLTGNSTARDDGTSKARPFDPWIKPRRK